MNPNNTNRWMSGWTRTIRLGCSLAVIAVLAGEVIAAPLTGSGTHLPVPFNFGVPPSELPQQTLLNPGDPSFGFTGTWGPPEPPVLPAWVGTFVAHGPIPSGSNPPGATDYSDFTNLAAGHLPAGTYFVISDVDGGSFTPETITLTAWDLNNNMITQPWLSIPEWVWGGAGTNDPNAMPGWTFAGGVYEFTGLTVAPGYNPNVGLAFESLTGISRFTVERPSEFAGFGLRAPVPEPATLGLIAIGGLATIRHRTMSGRRKRS